MRPLFVVSLLAFVAACASDPKSGRWDYTETSVSDGCNLGDTVDASGDDFDLENNGDGTFTITDPGSEDGEVFDCELDGKDFVCPERFADSIDEPGVSGEVLVSIEGRFKNAKTATGTQTATLDCEGAGCDAVTALFGTTFPCTIRAEFEAEYTGE